MKLDEDLRRVGPCAESWGIALREDLGEGDYNSLLEHLQCRGVSLASLFWAQAFLEDNCSQRSALDLATYFTEHEAQHVTQLRESDLKGKPDPKLEELVIVYNSSRKDLQESRLASLYKPHLYGHELECLGSLILIGTDDFLMELRSTLLLLKRRSHENFELVADNLGVIREWYQSGVTVYASPCVFYLSRKILFYSKTWAASCIVHDAYHAKLYRDYRRAHPDELMVPAEIFSGKERELECNAPQLKTLQDLQAPAVEIGWLENQDGSHSDLSWIDPESRPY